MKELAVGLVHVLALTENGEVYSWGKQEYAQCGDTTASDEPTQVTSLRGKSIVGIACGPTQVSLLCFILLFNLVWLSVMYA